MEYHIILIQMWNIKNIQKFCEMYVVCKSCHQFFYFVSILEPHKILCLIDISLRLCLHNEFKYFMFKYSYFTRKKKLPQKIEKFKSLEITPKLAIEMNEYLRSNISQNAELYQDLRLFFFSFELSLTPLYTFVEIKYC